MIYPKIDVLLEQVDSKYALVIAAARARARSTTTTTSSARAASRGSPRR